MAWQRGEQRNLSEPEVGKYALRLVKKGPEVASAIDFVDGKWVATINGTVDRESHEDPQLATGVQKVWLHGRRVPESEYLYLLERYRHAVEHDPRSPFANPTMPIDLRTMPPIGG